MSPWQTIKNTALKITYSETNEMLSITSLNKHTRTLPPLPRLLTRALTQFTGLAPSYANGIYTFKGVNQADFININNNLFN